MGCLRLYSFFVSSSIEQLKDYVLNMVRTLSLSRNAFARQVPLHNVRECHINAMNEKQTSLVEKISKRGSR